MFDLTRSGRHKSLPVAGQWLVWVRRLALLLVCSAILPASSCEDDENACDELAKLQARTGREITSPAEFAFSLADYTISGSSVSNVFETDCSRAVAQRLESNACQVCQDSPGQCESTVRGIFSSPPQGACSICGDGQCVSPEDEFNCTADCSASCGDRICDPQTENAESCPADCGSACGDGLCADGETPETCPVDCGFTIGDGQCTYGENPANAPQDCTGQEACDGGGVCDVTTCGDGFCQSWENSVTCSVDCCQQVCDPNQDGLVCVGQNVARCVPNGPGNCPEIEVVEVCEQGCGDGQCLVCPPQNGATTCDRFNTLCAGSNLRTCMPHPNLPGCELWTGFVDCQTYGTDYMCVEGTGCVERCQAQDQCRSGARRCVQGGRIEVCRTLGTDPCRRWIVEEACTCATQSSNPTCLE